MTSAAETPPENPLRDSGARAGSAGSERLPPPLVFVIFGASGDLTRRKLVPALFNLAQRRLLPAGFAVVGVARTPMDDEGFRTAMRAALDEDTAGETATEAELWESFAAGLSYIAGDFADPAVGVRLTEKLAELDRDRGTGGNRVYYLATPPSAYAPVAAALATGGLAQESEGSGFRRLVVEKPFGRDAESARQLDALLHGIFAESQIYRIDHYLGKETVQNLLVLRFANLVFEPLWNRQWVDHVQISAAEELGVEGRGGYYEEAGAVRDMVQNHLMQLLALTAMEPPVDFSADAVRDEKVKVLRAVAPLEAATLGERTVRAQYGPGAVAGAPVAGYRAEPNVNPQSQVPTYVALELSVDTWRWAGVPFYLRTGKRLPKRATEIAIQFRRTPHLVFRRRVETPPAPNVLVLRIAPDEGISLSIAAKLPGTALALRPVIMDFRYQAAFAGTPPTAYERLLLDCMLGDATLFTRSDEVAEAWRLVAPLLDGDPAGAGLETYAAGSWGPAGAEALLERSGRRWRRQ